MAVQRVFCVFCVSPFSYAWCVSYAWRVAYWRMVCGFCSDSNAASYLPADACARTSHARTSHARSEDGDAQNTIGVRCQKMLGRAGALG